MLTGPTIAAVTAQLQEPIHMLAIPGTGEARGIRSAGRQLRCPGRARAERHGFLSLASHTHLPASFEAPGVSFVR